jgi:hypothetical protein
MMCLSSKSAADHPTKNIEWLLPGLSFYCLPIVVVACSYSLHYLSLTSLYQLFQLKACHNTKGIAYNRWI